MNPVLKFHISLPLA